jgi:hypothetical protein
VDIAVNNDRCRGGVVILWLKEIKIVLKKRENLYLTVLIHIGEVSVF